MFIVKNKYFLIIESIKDLDLKNIKIRDKFSIIYRYKKITGVNYDLVQFRQKCKLKAIKFYVANDFKLASLLNADGIYLSSYNKKLKFLSYKKPKFDIIGSAHNHKEISLKIKQGCTSILFSKLFVVNYDKNSPYLGVVKFNTFLKNSKKLVPLGGINIKNLNQLKIIFSEGFALLSEVKKKPTKIFSRLF